jgi:hypothetical protein
VNTDPNNAGDSQEVDINQLLREAVAALKLGDKASARERLREVVAQDQYSEKGWMLLASAVETDEERRVCLGNVVVINPNNEQAQRLLRQLDNPNDLYLIDTPSSKAAGAAGGSNMPSVLANIKLPPPLDKLDRRLVFGAGAGLLVLLLMLCVVLFLPKGDAPAQVLVLPSETPTSTEDTTATAAVVQATQTRAAAPTQRTPATIGPTATRVPPTPAAPTPPPGLPGHLVVISGNPLTASKTLPIFLMDPNGQNQSPLAGGERGDYAAVMSDNTAMVYTYDQASLNTQQIRIVNLVGGGTRELSTLWGNKPPLADQKMLSIARNNSGIVFSAVGIAENDNTADIYYVPYAAGMLDVPVFAVATNTPTPEGGAADGTTGGDGSGAGGSRGATATSVEAAPDGSTAEQATPTVDPATLPALKIVRITAKVSGVNTWPALSPDGSQIVFASDTTALGTPGTDLYMVSTLGGPPQPLTTDQTAMIEAAPEWSPDGTKIVYQALAADTKTNQIYIMDAGTGANQTMLVGDKGDNIRPHWSPDGNFIAFTSNRTGKYEVYILEVATNTLYQVTQSKSMSLCTAWAS